MNVFRFDFCPGINVIIGEPEKDLEYYLRELTYMRDHHYLRGHMSFMRNLQQFIDSPKGNISKFFCGHPEYYTHPALMPEIAEKLKGLAESGFQVVLTTHSYLLMHELSLMAEYGLLPKNKMRFFSVYKEDGEEKLEVGETLADIDHNFVLDAYAAHYDREAELFAEVQE
jgi:predicted ATPase